LQGPRASAPGADRRRSARHVEGPRGDGASSPEQPQHRTTCCVRPSFGLALAALTPAALPGRQNKHARSQLDLAKKHADSGLHASASVILTLVRHRAQPALPVPTAPPLFPFVFAAGCARALWRWALRA